jgi:hypothetical protein
MNQSISFRMVPVYVSDEESRYFLFDMLLPHQYDEKYILLISRLFLQLRGELNNDKHNIDRVVASFFDSLPFYSFNFFYFHDIQEQQRRFSDKGILCIHVGDKTFTLSSMENEEAIVCMTFMKTYIE